MTIWNDPAVTPPTEIGDSDEYIVAVYRARTGKVYTFAASYLNEHRLVYDDCPKDVPGGCVGCDDGCPTTGWFTQTGDDDMACRYERLGLYNGDRLMGWSALPVWEGPLPTANAA
jgi:hypothetical protein